MRVLYVISYYKPAYLYGGSVTAVSGLCEALAQLGVEVTVLATNANGSQKLEVPLNKYVMVDGVQVIYTNVHTAPLRSYFYSPQLVRVCERIVGQFDIIFLDTLWTHALIPTLELGRRNGTPCIVPLHGQLMPWAINHRQFRKRLYLWLWGRRALNQATAVHCASHEETRTLNELSVHVPAFVVPYGLNTADFTDLPARGRLRHQLGIPDDAYMLLVLGRLHQVKRPDVALAAMTSVHRHDVHLVYAGPDEENLIPQLLGSAAQSGLKSYVHFLGLLNRAAVLQAFADSDILLMPSAMESFGMSAVEAMAAGVPVVVSEEVPVGRWATNANAGRSVPATSEAFGQTLNELLAVPQQLKIMGARGRQLAREQFDREAVARQMLRQLEAIVSTGQLAIDAYASQ